jgi:hypothetical protein
MMIIYHNLLRITKLVGVSHSNWPPIQSHLWTAFPHLSPQVLHRALTSTVLCLLCQLPSDPYPSPPKLHGHINCILPNCPDHDSGVVKATSGQYIPNILSSFHFLLSFELVHHLNFSKTLHHSEESQTWRLEDDRDEMYQEASTRRLKTSPREACWLLLESGVDQRAGYCMIRAEFGVYYLFRISPLLAERTRREPNRGYRENMPYKAGSCTLFISEP